MLRAYGWGGVALFSLYAMACVGVVRVGDACEGIVCGEGARCQSDAGETLCVCPPEQVYIEERCAPVLQCVDADGDTYGVDCAAGDDCDDRRADRWEICPPFSVNPAHPRLYVNAARIDRLREVVAMGLPLNGPRFPQARGRLSFDIYPRKKTEMNWAGIFDQYDASRNHMFVRYAPDNSTAVGQGIQVALQRQSDSYVAAYNFTIAYDAWHSIELAWDAVEHGATLSVDGVKTPFSWRKDEEGEPIEWRPDGQIFMLRGPDGFDNLRLSNGDLQAVGSTLVAYDMSRLVGGRLKDDTINGRDALVSAGARTGRRSANDENLALWLPAGSTLRIVAASPLSEAWLDIYTVAGIRAMRLLNDSDEVDPTTDHPNRLIGIARALGLAYLVTKEPRFVEAAQIYADRLLSADSAVSNDYTSAGRAEAMGILYDWFFDEMGSRLATEGVSYATVLRDGILAIVQQFSSYICGRNNPLTTDGRCTDPPAPDFVSGHAHQNDTEMTAALMAIVDESPYAENVLRDMYDIFTRGFNPARAWISVDGGHHMGWSYGAAYTFLGSIMLWEDTAGVPMKASWQAARIYPYIYGVRADGRFPASGDGIFRRPHHQQLAAFALWATLQFNDPYARSYYEQWVRPTAVGVRDREIFYFLGVPADTVTAAPFDDLPRSRHFSNAGQVVMRESWDFLDSALVEFKSTSFATNNHHHRDQNAFTIFYKAPLLVDSGDYDSYGTYHWRNYYTRTIAHNTLTVVDPEEVFFSGGQAVTNDGGQLMPPNTQLAGLQEGGAWHLDGITRFSNTLDYTYTQGNASKAYDATKLDQERGFVRSLVFLRSTSFWPRPVLVIFDEVNAMPLKADLVKRFLLHTVREPEPLGGTEVGPGQYLMPAGPLIVRNGGGMLFIDTLLPAGALARKIGGRSGSMDYRFMAPDAESGLLINIPPDEEPEPTPPDLGAWRIEITAPVPTEHEEFLHILSIADDTENLLPPSAVLLDATGGVACILNGTLVIAFRDDRNAVEQISFEMPNTAKRVLAFGFTPGDSYSYDVQSVENTTSLNISVTASNSGNVMAGTGGGLDFRPGQ